MYADAPAARMMREHSQSISAQNGSNPPVIANSTQQPARPVRPQVGPVQAPATRYQEPDGGTQSLWYMGSRWPVKLAHFCIVGARAGRT